MDTSYVMDDQHDKRERTDDSKKMERVRRRVCGREGDRQMQKTKNKKGQNGVLYCSRIHWSYQRRTSQPIESEAKKRPKFMKWYFWGVCVCLYVVCVCVCADISTSIQPSHIDFSVFFLAIFVFYLSVGTFTERLIQRQTFVNNCKKIRIRSVLRFGCVFCSKKKSFSSLCCLFLLKMCVYTNLFPN